MNWKEEFHKIDWESLEAYGSTDEILKLIAKLFTTDNQQDQYSYLNSLSDLIYHQGTIYEATGYVIQFFILMLKSDTVKVKKEIFFTIVAIYNGEYRDSKGLDVKIEISKKEKDLVTFLKYNYTQDKDFYDYTFDNFPDFLDTFPIFINATK